MKRWIAAAAMALCGGLLACVAPPLGAQTLEVLHGFDIRPVRPQSHVIEGSDGALYGTTHSGGGENTYGVIFRLNKDGTGLLTLHSLTGSDGEGAFPYAGVIEGSDGALYGTTLYGGRYSGGVVFKLNKDGTGYVNLHEFALGNAEGAFLYEGLLEGSDGALYGTTSRGGMYDQGVVFKLNKDGSGYLRLHDFDGTNGGAHPSGELVEGSDGALYGTARGGVDAGVVFKLNKDGSGFSSLKVFDGSDGSDPQGLVEGSEGALFGTTYQGGLNDDGVVFKLNIDGSGFQVLHAFDHSDGDNPDAGVVEGSDGALYGTTNYGGPNGFGSVFKLEKDGTGFLTLHDFNDVDGAYPSAGLLEGSDGSLYGTTGAGGVEPFRADYGVVFKLNKDGSGFLTLENFVDNDGISPYGGVVEGSDGALYGTTLYGGMYVDEDGNGVVFKVEKDGSGFLNLFDFNNGSGLNPYGGVIEGSDGALYGTADDILSAGVVFKLNKDGTGFLKLHEFRYNDNGWLPRGGLVEGSDGALYGTTYSGVVFKLNKDGTGFVRLHDFNDVLYAGVVEGSDAALYGTTTQGGAHGFGLVFKLNKDGTGFVNLHDFIGTDGANSYAALVEGSDGVLYGTTYAGGEYGYGVVFKISKDGSEFLTLHDFRTTDGANPYAGLVERSDGALYGTTYAGGANGYGTVFTLDKDGGGFRSLVDFNNGDGANPYAGLVEGSDGVLYGTTINGSTGGGGVVFRFASQCEASIRVEGTLHIPGGTLPVKIHLGHYRRKAVTVPWELRLVDASGQLVAKHTTEPHTFEPGDVVDRNLEFRLPDDLASGTYTLQLAISGMAGTKGATTSFTVVRVAEEVR